MFRPILAVLALVLLVGFVSAADPDPRSPPDVFGKPCPHGEPVEKGFLGLYSGRTDLFFGQPMRADLFAVAAVSGPAVNPRLDRIAAVELTDAAGKAVPFRLEEHGGGIGGDGMGNWSFTLWPTKAHAVGAFWKPGTYKLKMTVVIPNEPPAAKKVVTKTFRSNELTFTVREPGAALEKWDGKGKLRPIPGGGGLGGGNSLPSEDLFLYVAGLDDESSDRLRRQYGWEKAQWRLVTAPFAPVTVPQDRELTDTEAKKLIADLKDKAPDVRIRAVRSLPPTAPVEVIAAAVELLAAKYPTTNLEGSEGPPFYLVAKYARPGPFGCLLFLQPTDPVVQHAGDSLVRLGVAAVEPLIAFAEREGHKLTQLQEAPRSVVAGVLAGIGPNDAAEKYLRAAIRSGDDDRADHALFAATAWGKGGVGLTRPVLTMPKVSDHVRIAAIYAVKLHGDLKTDGPTLRTLLASTEPQVQWSALNALSELRDTESVPAFERIARDRKAEAPTRPAALDGVLALADAKTADRLVLDLIARTDDADMRYYALCQAGRRKMTAAVPAVLDALDDPAELTRATADLVLRDLARHPDGVGFDATTPDAKLWRDYWAKNEKK